MSFLIAISVGPVQEFIAAARRTRDLWFGSWLLSEISRSVAKAVESEHGKLIFPESSAAPNVANVILAELPTDKKPHEVATVAKQAAQKCWLEIAQDAWNQASAIIRREIWEDQVNDVIEFYAAWVPHTDPTQYQNDRKKLMRLLAGRKNCRDFLPAKGRIQVPKSSLDGQRETVLKDPKIEPWPKRIEISLRLRAGEQLDVVGLVKRIAKENKLYPSVSRVACDPWVRGIAGNPKYQLAFNHLIDACRNLPRNVLHQLDKKKFSQYETFPFEGTAVYVSRHHEWEEEIRDRDQFKIEALQAALKKLPEPYPYLAVLVADGDKMGAAISTLNSPEKHRIFSQTLAGFANEAEEIVEQYSGVLVYAGGDDVLAFLPVDQSLACARKLRNRFVELLKEYQDKKQESPTLSVGIAIGHFIENMEDLLEYGRAAEKAAKKVEGKDALAVHLHKRGGAPIRIADRWVFEPEKRLTLYAELMQKEALTSRLPYELHKLADLYDHSAWSPAILTRALQKDALRIIADKQPRAGRKYMSRVQEVIEKIETVSALRQFSDELLVARLLAEVFRQAQREPSELISVNQELVAK